MLRAVGQALELPRSRRGLLDRVPLHPARTVVIPAGFGVYVHFPYCTRRCPYCDFAVHARRRIPHEGYAQAVIRELEARVDEFPGRAASTAYFGGGTPGLWRPAALASVIEAVRARFQLPDGAEVTVEANPGEIDEAHLVALRRAGVNRLSIGAQSFDDRSLVVLGRSHDARAAREVITLARRAGFDNISVDLMFGLPRQGRAALDRELEALLSLEVEHLSLYGLTIEPRTAFAALVRERALELPDDEQQAELYERVRDRLATVGYLHHEISSWARPGRHARHNTLYWTGAEYLGVGSSASSLRVVKEAGGLVGERCSNLRSVDHYLAADRRALSGGEETEGGRIASRDRLEPDAFEREALWLGLRLVPGLVRAHHVERFGRDPLEAPELAGRFARLRAAGLLEIDEVRIALSRRGVLLADRVGAELV